eukprot:CAMPEP_0119080450 /NCGR_PEP_ID=MMETSP1178-20130426/112023_1 /TAXON_ID=33656 /ORGANISM="unid sp, Strain CCMP2000" /LENGTH=234 /DNA_ID=CAMNT_0007063051 /DNA_START=26 /DNA_END=730 /DNA_ORIENTATION=+
MKIRVAHGARRHEVMIPGSTTVADLKDKLQQLTGVPAEAQDLQIMGDSLCDEASLEEQGVQNLDKLELVAAGAGSPAAARVPSQGARSSAAPSGSADLRPDSTGAAEGDSASYRHAASSRDASPKPGGGSSSAPLAAALRTLDGVVAELDTMDSQVRTRAPLHQELFTRLLERMDCLELDSLSDSERAEVRPVRKALVQRCEALSAQALALERAGRQGSTEQVRRVVPSRRGGK